MGKFLKRSFVVIIVALIIFVAASYLRVEYLTIRYGEGFENMYQQTHMIESVDYYKVLEYTPTHVKVCYVKRIGGISSSDVNVIEFSRLAGGDWQICSWTTVRSATGSADGFTWPLYL